jgi:2,5-diamino-6-(ribosylamino)-4(3H)-pyrimidinone 5'-phosphate reductase
MTLDRPFVTLNVAVTADGKTDTVARRGAAISSPQDMARVDRLRAESDAILVGGRTLLGDDPRLTVKSAELRAERRARGLTENPIKVGIASNAELRLESRFLAAGPARVMLFTTLQTDSAQIMRLRQTGAEVFVLGETRVDLIAALRFLKESGVGKLLVEGGGTMNAELLRLGLVDEVCLYIAPLIFGGATAPTLADGAGLPRDAAIRLKLRSVERLDDEGILIYYLIPRT